MVESERRILIADDDPDARAIFSVYLTHAGFQVQVVSDGEEALKLAASFSPGLALLDVMMPGPSGMTLATLLKELVPDIEILIVTGFGSVGLAIEVLQKGAFCYLMKPVRPQHLLSAVEEAWAARESRRQKRSQEKEAGLRRLTAADVPSLHAVVSRDPYYNLFMIGNLEQMGIEDPHLFFWGQFSGDQLVGVAMRYKNNWNFYNAGGADLSLFAQAMDDGLEVCVINGRKALVSAIIERLRQLGVTEDHDSYYCSLPRDAVLPPPAFPTRRAGQADLPALTGLYANGELPRDSEAIRRCLDQNRIFVTEVAGQIVSAALTNVETGTMAMIGGVFTSEPFRNQGYASAAMTALCDSLLEDGLEPCLFYDDPAAGSIYRRLGFRDIGPWRMTRLRPR